MRVTTVNSEARKLQNSLPAGLTHTRKLPSKMSPEESGRSKICLNCIPDHSDSKTKNTIGRWMPQKKKCLEHIGHGEIYFSMNKDIILFSML